MTRTGIVVAALLMGTAANAQSGIDSVLSRLESQGFGRFEIEQERGQIKIEAHRGGEERELVYSATTGELLRDTIEVRGGRDILAGEPAGSLGGRVGPSAILDRAGLGGVYESLRREGFGNFETKEERGIIKVEAEKGSVERELRFDARTGELLRDRIDDDDDDRGRGRGRDDDDDDDDDRGRDRDRNRDRGGSNSGQGGGMHDDDDDDDDRGRGRGRGGHDDDDDDDDRD